MTYLSSRAARIIVYPVLKANPCNQIRCQQGTVQGAAICCASRHRHFYSTAGNALLARRRVFSSCHLSLRGSPSSPFTNKKNQPLAYRGICVRRRHNRVIPFCLIRNLIKPVVNHSLIIPGDSLTSPAGRTGAHAARPRAAHRTAPAGLAGSSHQSKTYGYKKFK